MTDYIKREDIVNLAVMMQTHLWTREQTYNAIFCLPSADVAPVRHGRWINEQWTKDPMLIGVTCSNCMIVEDRFYKYCPNCGARMDEGE